MNRFFQELKYGTTVTYILIFVNSVIFLFSNLLSTFFGAGSIELGIFMGGSALPLVLGGQLWRIVTANFLQISIFHFIFNMVGLYYYGKFIERFYSPKKMFLIYVVSGVVGTMLSLFYANSITFGASASIWGFLGVIVGNSLRKNIYSTGLPIDIKQMLPSMFFWLIIGFQMPGVSGLGHLGGFIGGVVLGYIIDTVNTFKPVDFENKFVEFGFWLSLVITILSFVLMIVSWLA